jgi:hypothetical protein
MSLWTRTFTVSRKNSERSAMLADDPHLLIWRWGATG